MKTYLAQRPLDDAIGDCRVFVQSDSGIRPLRQVVHHSPAEKKAGEQRSRGAGESLHPCPLAPPLPCPSLAAWLREQEAER